MQLISRLTLLLPGFLSLETVHCLDGFTMVDQVGTLVDGRVVVDG